EFARGSRVLAAGRHRLGGVRVDPVAVLRRGDGGNGAGHPVWARLTGGAARAILFAPLYRRLARRGRRTLAALATLVVIVVIVIVPLIVVAALVAQEGLNLYQSIQSGEIAPGRYLRQVFDALPPWATQWLDRFGLTDLGAVQERITSSLVAGIQFLAPKALSIGQNTFAFVLATLTMLYLLFFLLRDGDGIVARIRAAMPLRGEMQRDLAAK